MFRLKHLVIDDDGVGLYVRELDEGDDLFIKDIEYIVLDYEDESQTHSS